MPVNIYKRTTKTKGTQWEVIVSIGGRAENPFVTIGPLVSIDLRECDQADGSSYQPEEVS